MTVGIIASLAAQEWHGYLRRGDVRRQLAIRAYGLPERLAMPSDRKRGASPSRSSTTRLVPRLASEWFKSDERSAGKTLGRYYDRAR